MTPSDLLTYGSLLLVVILVTPVLGSYMARVMEGERTLLSPVLGPLERGVYRLAGIDPVAEQGWRGYALAVLAFGLLSVILLYALQRVQGVLPLNQAGLGSVAPDLAFNTAVSFASNTNWQNYSGETTMTYLTQAAGLTVQNFASAATGIAVAMALVRGLVRRPGRTIGSFWADLVRATLYVLLPLAAVVAVLLAWQGVPQTLAGPQEVTTVEGALQAIPLGPVASQEAIKQLGTNGGGFFGANAAHPFESPNGLTNWIHMASLLVIPFGLTATFGRLAGDRRQGWVIFAAMLGILGILALGAMWLESVGNPLFPQGIDQSLGNMEGKELRFGAPAGGLFAALTTGTSTGAVNAMHSSLSPLGGGIALLGILLGEVSPGGVGAGLYGILVFALLAVFIAGLMVGRTPEYLGKKVEAFEMKMAMLVILVPAASILGFTALAVLTPAGLAGPGNPGPHGFTEILYAYASQSANNGSAFASLHGDTAFYNVTGAIAMLFGRWAPIVLVLAIAGSMAAKRRVAPSIGTFPTTGPLFATLLVGVIVIVGALTFLPALALGPIVEQLLLGSGRVA